MKATILNESSATANASRLAIQLTESLRAAAVDATCFVRFLRGADANVRLIPFSGVPLLRLQRLLRRVQKRIHQLWWGWDPSSWETFDTGITQYGAQLLEALPAVDILNMHFVAELADMADFLHAMTSKNPVVWTVHDMNPFTGCHQYTWR